MSESYFRLVHSQARQGAIAAIQAAPDGFIVKISEPTRTLDQNAAQWPILQCIANQLQWPVNGALVSLADEEWKDILTAAFKGESIRLAQGVNGGVVMLGLRTSKFNKKDFSEWLEYLHWFCSEKNVNLKETA